MSPDPSYSMKNDNNPTFTDAAMTPGNQILYIVGNGFDLHHGIESSYQHFGENTWLKSTTTPTTT